MFVRDTQKELILLDLGNFSLQSLLKGCYIFPPLMKSTPLNLNKNACFPHKNLKVKSMCKTD